jgi:hypothetical protein
MSVHDSRLTIASLLNLDSQSFSSPSSPPIGCLPPSGQGAQHTGNPSQSQQPSGVIPGVPSFPNFKPEEFFPHHRVPGTDSQQMNYQVPIAASRQPSSNQNYPWSAEEDSQERYRKTTPRSISSAAASCQHFSKALWTELHDQWSLSPRRFVVCPARDDQ